MPQHSETRILPYTPQQVFDLVVDVEHYNEFLPWCQASRVYNQQEAEFTADVVIGYKVIREKYTCKVHHHSPDRINVEYLSGPFKYLKNDWAFSAVKAGCKVDFFIDYEFRNIILKTVAGAVFQEVVHRMISAFENAAMQRYGNAITVPDAV